MSQKSFKNQVQSLDFLPPNHRGEDFYAFVTQLIDFAINYPLNEQLPLVDPLVRDLEIPHASSESVNAYVNMFIKPSLGTRRVLDLLFKMMGLDAVITEWFESWSGMDAYHFKLEIDQLPEYLDVYQLVDLLNILKNERLHLEMIQSDSSCSDMAYWDMSFFDDNKFDDPDGSLVNGIYVCLFNSIRLWLDLATLEDEHPEIYYYLSSTKKQWNQGFQRNEYYHEDTFCPQAWDAAYWDHYADDCLSPVSVLYHLMLLQHWDIKSIIPKTWRNNNLPGNINKTWNQEDRTWNTAVAEDIDWSYGINTQPENPEFSSAFSIDFNHATHVLNPFSKSFSFGFQQKSFY